MSGPVHRATRADVVPVLIVGAGPVGLLMAILLARLGVGSTVIERRPPRVGGSPKAHVVNPRSLEIFRAAGLDVGTMYASGRPRDDGICARFVASLTGRELGVLPFESEHVDPYDLTPTPLLNLPQPRLETILRAAAERLPAIDLRYGHAWMSCRMSEGGVASSIAGPDGPYAIDSRYLVGADGAGSAVREALGIGMDGDPAVRARISIHFEADLRPLVRDRPGVLYWVLDPAIAGIFTAHDPASTWVFSPRETLPTFDLVDYSANRCADLVRRAIGVTDVELSVRHVVPWTMAAQVAATYRRGNCFLVGDAAHRFPPTGGLGLNTGLQDAHNLAWKIAAVERAAAGAALLDSYDAERRPIAEINTHRSLANSNRLPRLFGLARTVLADGAPCVSDLAALRREIESHRDHFCSIGLQLGFTYGPPAGVPDDVTLLRPVVEPGARLPHAWLRRGTRRLSILDLLDIGRFTLLAGEAGAAWASLASSEMKVVQVGAGLEFESDSPVARRLAARGAILVRPDGHVAATVDDDSIVRRGHVAGVLAQSLGH